MRFYDKFMHFLSYLGAPPTCLFCGEEDVPKNLPFCDECLPYFNKKLSQACPICGERSRRCLCIRVPCCESVTYVFLYGSKQMQRIMYHLKRNATRFEMEFLARFLCARLHDRHGADLPFDSVTFVPRKRDDKLYYGYDHAEMLAIYIANELGLPCISFIAHSGEGGEQKRLSRAERALSAKKRFALNIKHTVENKIAYKNVLLVDDITTTGATAEVCARIMKKAGVDNVHLAVISLAGYIAD